MIPEIDATQFDTEVTRSDRPVLVDFFTQQCGPCRSMLSILTEIADERPEQVKIVKIDAGKDPAFAASLRVRAVPNFILFQNGHPVGQRIGATPKREMLAWLDERVSAPL